MPDLNTSEALKHAKRVKGTFEVLSHAVEILEAVRAAEQALPRLHSDIERLENKKRAEQDDIQHARKQYQAEADQHSAAMQKSRDELEEMRRTQTSIILQEKDKAHQDRAAAVNARDQAELNLKKTLAEFEERTSAAQTKLDQVTQALEKLQKQLEI
jgi:DNA repair exonuclease SbcCD ATPase subunit